MKLTLHVISRDGFSRLACITWQDGKLTYAWITDRLRKTFDKWVEYGVEDGLDRHCMVSSDQFLEVAARVMVKQGGFKSRLEYESSKNK